MRPRPVHTETPQAHTCHVCQSEFSTVKIAHPRGLGDEFEYAPMICPICDAPVRRHPRPMSRGVVTNFIFGIFGDLGSSAAVGGAQNMLRRRIRSEREFDDFLEFVAAVDIEDITEKFQAICKPDDPDHQRMLQIIPRVLAEARTGQLDARVRSMVAQAKAELLAERERHLAILGFRRAREIV